MKKRRGYERPDMTQAEMDAADEYAFANAEKLNRLALEQEEWRQELDRLKAENGGILPRLKNVPPRTKGPKREE